MKFRPRMSLPEATQAICLIGVVLVLALMIGALQGCASEPYKGTCAIVPLGQSDQGVAFAKVYCERAE